MLNKKRIKTIENDYKSKRLTKQQEQLQSYRLTFAKSPLSTASRYFFSSSESGFGKLRALDISRLASDGRGELARDGASIWRPIYCSVRKSWI